MTTTRGALTEITPDEPPGAYPHVTDGTPCWCRPVKMGKVIVHRPWVECGAEVWESLLASNVFPMPWNANRA
jgi:hypothetical protein